MAGRRRAVLVVIAVVLLAMLLPLLLVLVVDPFRIYHAPWIVMPSLQENQRYQNAGLVNRYLADPAQQYDAIIVGTSMSQNFTVADVTHYLGWHKPLRLLMPGAVASEQLAVLQHALSTGHVKHVLLELHPFLYQDTYRQTKQVEADHTLYFPAYLYDDSWLDDAPYVFNIDVLKLSWHLLLGDSTGKRLTPETIGYWGNDSNVETDHRAFNSAEHLRQLREQTAGFRLHPLSAADADALQYPVLDALLPVLHAYCNTGTEFTLFVPPWPRFRYQKSEKVTLRSVYLLRHVLQGIAMCPNIHLYDFDHEAWTGDLNYYKDEQHYLPAMNRALLAHIARHENEVTPGNVGEFEDGLIDSLNHYTVMSSYPSALPLHE